MFRQDGMCGHSGATYSTLVLALDPEDNPITTLQILAISSGAANLILRPDIAIIRNLRRNPESDFCFGDFYWDDGGVCNLGTDDAFAHDASRKPSPPFKRTPWPGMRRELSFQNVLWSPAYESFSPGNRLSQNGRGIAISSFADPQLDTVVRTAEQKGA